MLAEKPKTVSPEDVALEQLSYSSMTHSQKTAPIIKSYSNVEPGTRLETLTKKVTKKPHHTFVRNMALEQDLEREESMRRWIMLLNADEQIASGMQHVQMEQENQFDRNKQAEEWLEEDTWGCYGDNCYTDDDYMLNASKGKETGLTVLFDQNGQMYFGQSY